MAVFFIADTHFGDDAIIRYENRPFGSADEMEKKITDNWNSIVLADDEVFLLGDIAAYDKERTRDIINRLNGRKSLIIGNHDVQDEQYYYDCGFSFVSRYPILYQNYWLLSHEPLYVCTNMPYANIFGHVHASPLYVTVSPQSYCVSVERINYTPISFDSIKQAVREQVMVKK